jgi:hypothetical protein
MNEYTENNGFSGKSGDENKSKKEYAEPTYDVCNHCDSEPCVVFELEEMLLSLLECYRDIKTKKQIRFAMYRDSVKHIHGPGLGKGVRKKLPQCLQRKIHSIVPDDKYTGFMEYKEDKE